LFPLRPFPSLCKVWAAAAAIFQLDSLKWYIFTLCKLYFKKNWHILSCSAFSETQFRIFCLCGLATPKICNAIRS